MVVLSRADRVGAMLSCVRLGLDNPAADSELYQ